MLPVSGSEVLLNSLKSFRLSYNEVLKQYPVALSAYLSGVRLELLVCWLVCCIEAFQSGFISLADTLELLGVFIRLSKVC